ncbi:MAG TPA: FAD-dependent oxidoreductase [Gaiellaceae bacterium]|jgi:sarcosine oxidase|nr:FAD-dependent oxidoreductase [Gaiellaceae bacterium]
MRATVVGAGINGCAAAWALRRRGVEVALVDQFEPGHVRGSSHGRSRIFRLAYPERHWVELAEEALIGWRELEQETGATLLELYGLVELCSSVAVSSRDVLEACGIEHRLLGRDEFDVALPDGWIALWQRDAGIVRADLALEAFRGDLPVEQRRVESLDDVDGDVVIVTAGPWAPLLLPDLPVRVTRETVAYFAHDGAPLPSVVELDEATRHHAMYALHDPVYGLKAGAHHAGPVADPDVATPPDTALVEQITSWVNERFPHIDPEPVAAETCVYTTTDDESFILERRGRVVVGSACSGHAFKFAPAVGKRLADLAIG